MAQTAMQDLRSDLNETLTSANDALMEIKDETVRTACQEIVKITLKNIIKRIDDELLEMEKQQIIDAWDRGQYIGSSFPNNQIEVEFEKDAEQYYNEIFKNK